MFTTSSRGTAEQNLEKGKREHQEYFLKEKILRVFLFPVKKVEGSRMLVRGTRTQLLQGRQSRGRRCPWPRATPASSARDRQAQPLHTPKPSCRTRLRLRSAVWTTSRNKNTSATLPLSMEGKMAVSKSQLLHVEKHALHKSDHFNPISLKATKTHSLGPFSPLPSPF